MKKTVSTDKAPEALGPYNQAVIETGSGLVFTSGQIGVDPRTGELVGKDVQAQTRQVFANLRAVLDAAGCSLRDVLKVTVFLKDLDDFAKMNEVYSENFIDMFPARATVEIARLPKDALVEMELVALRSRSLSKKGQK